MNNEESDQVTKLNAGHGDIDPSFGARFRGLVIAHQAALVHQPTEGVIEEPAAALRAEGSLSQAVTTCSSWVQAGTLVCVPSCVPALQNTCEIWRWLSDKVRTFFEENVVV
jgi:hypothetical protein